MNNTLHMKLLLSSTALLVALSHNSFAGSLELKPVSHAESFQIAAITFLPDMLDKKDMGDVDININIDTKWCEDNGYTYGCPSQQAPYETCSRDNSYVKCSKAVWCKLPENNYVITSCSLPKYVNKECPNGEKLYKECVINNQQACKDTGYVTSCPSGQKLYNTASRCSWDNSYGKCCKPSGCPANTSTSGSYGDSGSKDSCGYNCYYNCNMNCPAGTTEANPGGCGGSTTNGCGTKICYLAYKACCNESCPSGTSEVHPGGCPKTTQNECRTKTCYYGYQKCCPSGSFYAYGYCIQDGEGRGPGSGASSYCSRLGGRLPSQSELRDIWNKCGRGCGFSNGIYGSYWSSNSCGSGLYRVGFYDGGSACFSTSETEYYRCLF